MKKSSKWAPAEAGSPCHLGAAADEDGVNFALFSAHATRVELCLFDETGTKELHRVDLPEHTDEVWHGRLPGAKPGLVYGYRVHGPYKPDKGHRFNHHKLVLDPYARALVGQLQWGPSLFGYQLGHPDADLSFCELDSAQAMPKARVLPDDPRAIPARPAWRRPWDRTIVYETHAKGFTQRHPAVPADARGRFKGLAHPEVIAYIRSLGVSSVELLPIHAFADEPHLHDHGLSNFWGYNTIAFFAPDARYLSGGQLADFTEMVDRLHDAGLEVLLDVVYNHTAEGNGLGPTISFKGIDNASYYRLDPQHPRHYINDTGTGNTINANHPRVLQMIMDSLRYWAGLGVDGFRFDLATVLGREPQGFDQTCGFFQAWRQDPVLSPLKFIAEPWDCGPGGYQVGGFPPGWAEWNDAFRDQLRAFWRGDEKQVPSLASRLTASADRFRHRGRKPWASVNFITAHDGFTLADLVAYNDRHNEANGENNRDGNSNNISWNCGAEGPTDDEEILKLRARQQRNLLLTLLLAHGTPMLLAGDEAGRTQQGNNNAYCQDNEISWMDWDRTEDQESLTNFVRKLLWLRDTLAVLRPKRHARGRHPTRAGIRDVAWVDAAGRELQPAQWNDAAMRSIGMLADARALLDGRPPAGQHGVTTLLVVNAHHDLVLWSMPAHHGVARWTRIVDTNAPLEREIPEYAPGDVYEVTGRSALLFVSGTDAASTALVKELVDGLRRGEISGPVGR
ncbi:MAG: glycogen debranching protein GlgX [Aquabacterium sp.]|jgi:isoamylase|uniref:glycogen debranching protein GlgX n=1 Tax=Aquabacterium sp. TaxID=1872578 RepID=UPI003BB118CF